MLAPNVILSPVKVAFFQIVILNVRLPFAFKPGVHIVVMVVSTLANMFVTQFQAVLIHVNTLIATSQA